MCLSQFIDGTLVVVNLESDYVTCTLPSCKQIAGGHPPQRALLQKKAGVRRECFGWHAGGAVRILASIMRKRDIEVYTSRSRSSGGLRKEQKEMFIETRRRTDGCMQKIDSLVLQSAVRLQVATTYRSVAIKTTICSSLFGCELSPASVQRPRPASVHSFVRPSVKAAESCYWMTYAHLFDRVLAALLWQVVSP